jgi:hypothetical protein
LETVAPLSARPVKRSIFQMKPYLSSQLLSDALRRRFIFSLLNQLQASNRRSEHTLNTFLTVSARIISEAALRR